MPSKTFIFYYSQLLRPSVLFVNLYVANRENNGVGRGLSFYRALRENIANNADGGILIF